MGMNSNSGGVRGAAGLDPDDVGPRLMLSAIRLDMFGTSERMRFGRFEVEAELGRGAHGAVYLAHDTELNRQVALKLLARRGGSTSASARLVREAQALAQLKHPNVLTVYDAGVERGRIFIATEYVEGGTLAQWAKKNPPGGRARFNRVLQLAIATARGLSATHRAGVVHRDVKPANILVGEDGRPRVADFGLARAADQQRQTARDLGAQGTSSSDEKLTATGDVVGTPAYMAPEQFDGPGDAASDQFSLCVALWEVAYGELPHDPRRRRSSSPPPLPARKRNEVPAWWGQALQRGLAPDPADRWPSVAALAGELESAAGRRQRRLVLARAAVAATVGVCAFAGWLLYKEHQPGNCEAAAAAPRQEWSEEPRADLLRAFGSSELPYASTSAEHTAAYLDAYVSEWEALYTARCIAARVDATIPIEAWSGTDSCLNNRRQESRLRSPSSSRHPRATSFSSRRGPL